jgi:hypothetical protein
VFALGSTLGNGADAAHCLVAAVIWGAGTRSRWWPSRLSRLLADSRRSETEQHFWAAVGTLRAAGAVEAYAMLRRHGPHHLTDIGPSFFSKLLYFAGWDSAAGDLKPLVIDRYVVAGLNQQRGAHWNVGGPWTSEQYRCYLQWAHTKAAAWGAGAEPDVVERRIWEYGRCLRRRQA